MRVSVFVRVILLSGVWRKVCHEGSAFVVPSIRRRSVYESSSSSSSSALMGIKGFRAWFESQFPEAVVPLTHSTSSSSANNNNNSSSSKKKKDVESFDHVLMDVNQLLHIVLRRAKSEGHALTLLIKELDHHSTIAQPNKCLVLALDGPPSAAKLATQRRRRYGTVVRGKLREERMEFIQKRQQQQQLSSSSSQTFYTNHHINATTTTSTTTSTVTATKSRKKKQKHRQSKLARDVQTLCITPGTDFMERAHSAILYWAWQRLANPFGPLAHVKIYISPSNVPGEGEVKLLDWLWHNANHNPITTANTTLGGRHHSSNHKRNNHPNNNNQQQQYKKKKSMIQPGDSVAIMGGDSDLVLEAFIISPSYITHNVFCILPDGAQKSYAISLWEATRTLYQFLQPQLHQEDIMRVRTDLVLLLIMNGNDYLPKLRGSSGFHKLFHTYLRLLKDWLLQEHDSSMVDGSSSSLLHKHGTKRPPPFLVDPDTLQFNIPFCIAFFRKLALIAPKVAPPSELLSYQNSVTPLSHLHTLIDSGFLPKPIRWERITYQQQNDNPSISPNNNNNTTTTTVDVANANNHSSSSSTVSENDTVNLQEQFMNNGKMELLRLTLGTQQQQEEEETNKKGEEQQQHVVNDITTQYFTFETIFDTSETVKRTKQRLANMALEEILGKDYVNMHEYLDSSYDTSSTEDSDDDQIEDEEEESDDDDDNDAIPMSSTGYSWEIKTPVACKVDDYLGGLLWNLQTYQDGVCTDYGYNYGRRMSPTAEEIVDYLKEVQQQNNTRILGRSELLGDKSVPPLNAGLSCLAALPSEVQHLVPEPYRRLSVNSSVEEIYACCMDPDANVFDIQTFQRLCMEFIEKTNSTTYYDSATTTFPENEFNLQTDNSFDDLSSWSESNKTDTTTTGRKILTSDKYWTVFQKTTRPIPHPFAPPQAFSPRLSKLKPNNRIKVSRVLAADKPRHLDSSQEKINGFRFSDASGLLQRDGKNKNGELQSLENLPYKVAYKDAKEAAKRRVAKMKSKRKAFGKDSFGLSSNNNDSDVAETKSVSEPTNVKKSKHRHRITDEEARMKQFQMIPPPSEASKNIEGLTAIQCLQQLKDVQLLSIIQWEWIAPSQTPYASFNPEAHETVKLTVKSSSFINNNIDDIDNKDIFPEELVLEQDRNINDVSRKVLKQHLAAIALQKLIESQKSWTGMTLNEMKEQLTIKSSVVP